MEKVAALQRTKMFEGLGETELAQITQKAVELRLQAGEMLFFSGERAKESLHKFSVHGLID